MKKIKFRAFHKIENRMYNVNVFNIENGFVSFNDFKGELINEGTELEGYSRGCNLEDVELMQYTGLRDAKNEEWYHEDIGEFPNGDKFIIKCEEWLEFFIEWVSEPKCEDQTRDFYRITNAVKIGNKYENPELTEE